MLSFLQQQLKLNPTDVASSRNKSDRTMDGDSAFLIYSNFYTGGKSPCVPKDTTRIRVDKSARHLSGTTNYGHIFSLELPPSIMSMDTNLGTQGTSCATASKMVCAMQASLASLKPRDVFKSQCMNNLRNVAFPSDLQDKDLPTFDTTDSDLGRVLPAKRNDGYIYRLHCNGYALRDRFSGLPVHKICYYHSHGSPEVAIRNLSSELGQASSLRDSGGHRQRDTCGKRILGRDVIGMTPLHILSCSTKHHLDMYRMLIAANPDQLITEDVWGGIPLMYALWGRAPWEVVELLARSMQELHHYEEYVMDGVVMDWEKRMIETFCRGMAPMACVKYLFEAMASLFPELEVQEGEIDWNRMVRLLCTNAKASEEHVRNFMSLYQCAFPRNNSDLEWLSLDLAREEKFGFKPFWLKLGIYSRLSLLDKSAWRHKIQSMIEHCPTGSTGVSVRRRVELMEAILRKLDYYETTAQLWVLELALWKARIGGDGTDNTSGSVRSCCRIMSGADVIVPNVLEYL